MRVQGVVLALLPEDPCLPEKPPGGIRGLGPHGKPVAGPLHIHLEPVRGGLAGIVVADLFQVSPVPLPAASVTTMR